ncbi:MAG: cell division protein FtsW [Rhodospirillaceae bacterium TMED8]|nr:cell division protein FtsW [Magnetovibrio sp.]OUT52299.1 MAG: cell division protein FtsW [Rhodospirillaceae bacterium TMED8]
MSAWARTDTSLVGRWWWNVDRWMLAALVCLSVIGTILTLAGSPPVAARLKLDIFHFAGRQILFIALAMIVMIFVSFLSVRGVRRLAAVMTFGALILMVATLIVGTETKGATRWLYLWGFSIQPSEFIKPGFAVMAAWFFSVRCLDDHFPGYTLAGILYVFVAGLLLLQPDVGMTFVVSAIWGVQFFIAGLPLIFVVVIIFLIVGGSFGAYITFSHVQVRVDRFLDPEVGVGYQVSRSLEAFRNGGWAGRGPGEGRVKEVLPDAHTDFIFAVAGEEFGLIVCLIILALFVFVILRGISRVMRDEDLFALLAVAGLLVQFALQALINTASTVNLMPPKGMTLPFISYGGSSTLALGFGLGMVLALTRIRAHPEEER